MSLSSTRRARGTTLAAAGLVLAGLTLPGAASAAGRPTAASPATSAATRASNLAADSKVADPATKVVQLLKQPDGFTFPARMTDMKVGGLFET